MKLFKRAAEDPAAVNTATGTEAGPAGAVLRARLEGGGETVPRDVALSVPVIAKAVDMVCNTVAGLPVKLYREKDGKVEEVKDDYRVQLLNAETGDTLDGGQVRRAMVEDYFLSGGGYAVIEKNRNKISGLYYVKSERVHVMKGADEVHKNYSYQIGARDYQDFEVLKILRNTRDGMSGQSVIAEISTAIETVYENMLYQLMLVKTGGNKKGFLTSENHLTEEAIKTLREAWKNLYSSSSENIVVLNRGIKFQESSNSNVEMQLNETQSRFSAEIDNIFQISSDDARFLKYGIMPIVRQLETSYNKYLLLEREKKGAGALYFAFDTTELTRGNLAERYAAYKTAVDGGWLSKNEVRHAENREKVEGLDTFAFSLGTVLYNPETKEYFTPNTKTLTAADGGGNRPAGGGEE